MSRSGYIEGFGNEWQQICWRGAVASAIRGRRGQAFLREMLAALDAMPEKRLTVHELEEDLIGDDGTVVISQVCAIGAVGVARGMDMSQMDPEDPETVAGKFGIATALVREIVYVNDEDGSWFKTETPEERFVRVRAWVMGSIQKEESDGKK